MNRFTPLFSVLAAISLLAGCCNSRLPQRVEYPRYSFRSDTLLELVALERTDTAAVLSFKAFFNPRWYINFSPGAYLTDGNERYALTGAEGITPGEELYMDDSGSASFRLMFEPLPPEVTDISLIEQEDAAYAFNFYHIDLGGHSIAAPSAQQDSESLPSTDNLTPNEKATVEVRMPGSLTGLPAVRIAVSVKDPTGQRDYLSTLDENGTATVSVGPLSGPASALLEVGNGITSDWIPLKPGGTVRITVDGSARALTLKRFSLKDDGSAPPVFTYE